VKYGWRARPILERDPRDVIYAEQMAELQRKTRTLRPRVPIPDGVDRDEFIFGQQAKSTQTIIELQKDPDYKRDWTAPLPDGWLANPEAKTLDEMVNKRELTEKEREIEQDIRRKGHSNTEGQSMLSGASDERKKSAEHHFLVSPPAPAPQDKERISQLTKIVPFTPPKEVWHTLSWAKALIHRIKGGKVVKKEVNNQTYWGYWSNE
jgi:hypothetical protein